MEASLLFDLIKSLDRTEKRSLKLYLSKYETTRDNKSLILLDAINQMDYFDKEELLLRLKNTKLIDRLAVEMARLLQVILRFLSEFSKGAISTQLYSMLKEVEVLVEKNQLGLAFKIIDKGIGLSASNNELVIAYLFFNKKTELAHIVKLKRKEQIELLEEYKSTINQMANNHHEFIASVTYKLND